MSARADELIIKLEEEQALSRAEWAEVITLRDEQSAERLFEKARKVSTRWYGHDIYVRGLIEFSNYCRNDCYYCGIRKSNAHANRYRLSEEEILDCCGLGYELGYRTFVLQSGEDGWYMHGRLEHLAAEIRRRWPECAITLSVGELSREEYQRYFDAGVSRYLLRHETADPAHYRLLHPESLSARHRQNCLWELKDIGYQVGAGFMVGSPYQTPENLADDMLFLKELNPQMVGIGPFIPHHDTPFADKPAGTLELTLYMLGLLRLMLPKVLLPATTALGTISSVGREKGVLAGANVIMPNLSPTEVRKDYLLYDNKICTGDESAQCRSCLERRMAAIGYHVVVSRGDSLNIDS